MSNSAPHSGNSLPLQEISQVCVVVRDLDRAMRHYWEILGIGPWRVYTYGPPLVKDQTYRGKPATYRMRLAIANVGNLMFELIQPLEGPSIYHEFVDRCGEGLHHLGIFVPNLDAAIAEWKDRGYEVLMSGRGYGVRGDGGYAYLTTEGDLSAILELIEIPAERYPPEAVYPPES
jgi:methylmalonyl-CoA/ethylmalonyl-CoA epimerase